MSHHFAIAPHPPLRAPFCCLESLRIIDSVELFFLFPKPLFFSSGCGLLSLSCTPSPWFLPPCNLLANAVLYVLAPQTPVSPSSWPSADGVIGFFAFAFVLLGLIFHFASPLSPAPRLPTEFKSAAPPCHGFGRFSAVGRNVVSFFVPSVFLSWRSFFSSFFFFFA